MWTVALGNMPLISNRNLNFINAKQFLYMYILFSSVADPDPDPVGSGFFGRIRIRIRVLGPGSGSDLTEISIFFLSSIIAKAGIILFKQC